MDALTPQQLRKRASAEDRDSRLQGHDRNGGAPVHTIRGYSRGGNYSNIDYMKLRQGGMQHDEAVAEAQRMQAESSIINPQGKITPNDNPSAREQAARDATTQRAKGQQSNAEFAGASPPPSAAAAPRMPDPSTVRQPAGAMPIPFDADYNPPSESNPIAGTPAAFRQMARDAATGRSVNTSGTTGLTPSSTPGARPTQAADFRRTITSRYGTGSNVTRAPGQAPGGMTTDLMGRPTTIQNEMQERNDIQASKGMVPGAPALASGAAQGVAPMGATTPARLRQTAMNAAASTKKPFDNADEGDDEEDSTA